MSVLHQIQNCRRQKTRANAAQGSNVDVDAFTGRSRIAQAPKFELELKEESQDVGRANAGHLACDCVGA